MSTEHEQMIKPLPGQGSHPRVLRAAHCLLVNQVVERSLATNHSAGQFVRQSAVVCRQWSPRQFVGQHVLHIVRPLRVTLQDAEGNLSWFFHLRSLIRPNASRLTNFQHRNYHL